MVLLFSIYALVLCVFVILGVVIAHSVIWRIAYKRWPWHCRGCKNRSICNMECFYPKGYKFIKILIKAGLDWSSIDNVSRFMGNTFRVVKFIKDGCVLPVNEFRLLQKSPQDWGFVNPSPYNDPDTLIEALQRVNIKIDDNAISMMEASNFKVFLGENKIKERISLVQISVAELVGFLNDGFPKNNRYTRLQVYEAAFGRGLLPCSPIVGPLALLQNTNQPDGSCFYFAMEPIFLIAYGSKDPLPFIFKYINKQGCLVLEGCWKGLGDWFRPEDKLIFCYPQYI